MLQLPPAGIYGMESNNLIKNLDLPNIRIVNILIFTDTMVSVQKLAFASS
jgi:hypothetical protein